ncbi:DNA polymerase III subunit gamma/tau [Mesomycoplasma conjunctivae]|uniref:DNA polymerase III subunit gamma/tau n=1 Tax=Mesomycoplasma conjunctivae TaxID=45361 RepID=UPI003DA3A4BA
MSSKYIAWYRKYRPQTFNDVVGQELIVQSLKNIITSQQYFHAYLFAGSRGTGKTSLAKIFANTLNCQHKRDLLIPCETCIANINNSLDIIEIDAASNNGVKEIRELIENVANLPQNSPYKVYIMDEAHMLTTSAFNAFLKTLEEPPKHVIFILATTEVHKIPLTILSRLQRFNFVKVQIQDVIKRLEFVLQKEAISYEVAALEMVAKLSEGSLRDALSILEQVSTFGNGKLNLSDVETLFGLTSNEKIVEFINSLYAEDIKESLAILKQIFEQGKQTKLFLNSILNLIKNWLIYNIAHSTDLLSNSDIEILDKIKIDKAFAYKLQQIIFETIEKLIYSDNSNSFLEMMVIKIIAKKEESRTVESYANPVSYLPSKITENTIITNTKQEFDNQKIKINFQRPKDENPFQSQSWKSNISVQIPTPQQSDKPKISALKKSQEIANFDGQKEGNPSPKIAIANNDSQPLIETIDEHFNEQVMENNLSYLAQEEQIEHNSSPILEQNLTNNALDSQLKDYLSVDEVVNLIFLTRDFVSQNKDSSKDVQQKWNQGISTYEYDDEYIDIIRIIKQSKILAFDNSFILLGSKEKSFDSEILDLVQNNSKLQEYLEKIFGDIIHIFAISKNMIEQAKQQIDYYKQSKIEFTVKPLPQPKKKIVNKEDLDKMIFG